MPEKMPRNQKILLLVRFVVGIAGVVAGSLIYPTGRIVPSARAVPLALIIVGAIFAAQAVLDLAWAYLSDRDDKASKANAAAARTAAGAFARAKEALDRAWADLPGEVTRPACSRRLRDRQGGTGPRVG